MVPSQIYKAAYSTRVFQKYQAPYGNWIESTHLLAAFPFPSYFLTALAVFRGHLSYKHCMCAYLCLLVRF